MPRVFIKMPNPDKATSFVHTSFTSGLAGPVAYQTRNRPNVLIAEIPESALGLLADSGAIVYPDFEFGILPPAGTGQRAAHYWEPRETEASMLPDKSLQDVLNHIRAPNAWKTSRGAGVTIAVVDTGVCSTLNEFPAAKRSPLDIPSAYSGHHWADTKGHGSMCATIAAATKAAGGKFNGVAPDATVISARTTLMASDIHIIYDELISAKKQGSIPGPLVMSNSYGLYTCSAPTGLPEDHPYLDIVVEAVKTGIPVVFAAGNNHWDVLCRTIPRHALPIRSGRSTRMTW